MSVPDLLSTLPVLHHSVTSEANSRDLCSHRALGANHRAFSLRMPVSRR